MKQYQGYFIDLDGTVYRGKERIPAAARFIKRLQEHQREILFVTNNSTRSPKEVAANLRTNHDINVTAANVYTSAMATADYLVQHAGQKRRVYVIGERGLKDALLNKGMQLTDQDPDYVVIGLDRNVTYEQFKIATFCIRAGAVFIGTNGDTNLPSEEGMIPSAGALVELVRYATQQEPIMIGKPQKTIVEMALKASGLKKSEVLMVGDNYQTDVQAGINTGVDTLLVYTGLSKPADIEHVEIKPTYTVKTLDEWNV
ncbi:TIGR01457 family HAD-type hydrolase [Limosilactobacillus mucosae]|uniref:TIGR01457 family HAD-type hydrolase n=1 Tax=Limosilactobacillus mucosae TaxID=97478 RepID=UPI000883929A|nr:TIGR01457 family HAD-type hydrolase [Limosilactobacillus mucosae]SDN44087.1 4-nitrophenyl phosphatase [Limosilactobacillus mucosae]SEK87926.1 4-nitrophenyl phosphatase [Limosilactobacillus mucosae]SFK18156.1 4-nitrophenyl phosphatase [Limosilactobacillus mucosae]